MAYNIQQIWVGRNYYPLGESTSPAVTQLDKTQFVMHQEWHANDGNAEVFLFSFNSVAPFVCL